MLYVDTYVYGSFIIRTEVEWTLDPKNQIRMSEWLLFNANSAIFQPYLGEDRLIFNEMMMRSTLY